MDEKNTYPSVPQYDHQHMDNFINDSREYANENEKNTMKTIRTLTSVLEVLLDQEKNLNIFDEGNNDLTVKSVAQFHSMIEAEAPEIDEEGKLENVSLEEITPVHDPRWIKLLPNFLMIFNAIAYMAIGGLIFQLLDAKVAEMPYYKALLLAFQVTCTIGWGSPYIMSYTASKAFCVVYTMFGIPIVFAAFANVGRENKTDDRITRLPLKVGVFCLILHEIWGIIMFNYWLHQFGIIGSIYFSIISISTTGLGDFKPDPSNIFETILVILYICCGITIISAIYASLAYYWHRFHFVTVKKYMVKFGAKIFFKNRHSIKPVYVINGNFFDGVE